MAGREHNVQYFLNLIKRSRRGRFKIYIGMIAGVGKTYRMLQEAHEMLNSGLDVKIGYVETHGRADTEAMLEGLPVIPRKKIFYKGKELEEMDLDAIPSSPPFMALPGSWEYILASVENFSPLMIRSRIARRRSFTAMFAASLSG